MPRVRRPQARGAARYAATFVGEGRSETIRQRLTRSPALAALAALPLVLAAVLLLWRPWAPTLDMAMTELRVRDVGGRHTPLIGLPGRIGDFPDQGSHPGPLSFYLVAPFYRLAGASAWGMQLGSVVVNAAAIAGTVAIGARLAGRRGAVVLAAICAVAVRGYGLNVLTHPWNPYVPVLIWLLVLVAAWAVLAGDHSMAVVVAVGASVAAQTHVPYLLNGIAVCALVFVVLVWRWRFGGPDAGAGRPLLVAVGVGSVLWLPPVVDQLVRDPGNIRRLLRHFATEPPADEPVIALGDAVRVFFRHLDAIEVAGSLVVRQAAFVHRSGLPGGSGWGGAVVFALWLAAAAVAWRRRHRRLNALNAVVAVALAVGAFSISRIFGKVWFYLTLWLWAATLLMVLSIAWAAALELAARRERRAVAFGVWPAAAVGAAATIASLGAAFVLEVPEPQLSDGLRAVLPATIDAIDDGVGDAVGPDGRYVVFWQDAAYNGSQGYGLVNELDKRGYQVFVQPAWRVPVTPQRVVSGPYDAEIHIVSGVYIEEWAQRPGYVQVTEYDRRDDAERARFASLRERVETRLVEIGRSDLMERVDRNLFGASLEPGLPQDVVDALSEMLLLSVPIAVFVAPAGSTS